LNSVFKALENVNGEVFVVDNNSIDNSLEMVASKFPSVKLIANKENVGFSKANNQAIELSQGKYVLLLNPDTVVEESTFVKTIDFLNQHPNAGGLGVRMLDGKGNFLPESKRGLPTPSVAFYKIFGISTLFPKSKLFGKYHLGYLPENKTNKIEILSGAFMLLRKETLNKIGLLDETFFMYGEDIDLSYRVILAGYDNYYFPETSIIHYKGESTKKSSVNYVFVFYNAMIIFAKKHFSQNNAALFSFLINIAIYLRAGMAISARFIKKSILPTIDFIAIYSALVILSTYWQYYNIKFPPYILYLSLPAYTLTWMLSNLYVGGYDLPSKLKKHFSGTIIGTILILIVYGLLPKTLQFSRLFILIGTLGVLTYYILSRFSLHLILGGKYGLKESQPKTFAIIGSSAEIVRVNNLLKQTHGDIKEVIFVSSTNEKEKQQHGTIDQLDQIVHIHKVDEVIFCAKDISSNAIISWMSQLANNPIDFKIAQPDTLFLIGSNSTHTSGEDLYVLNLHAISKTSNIRNKRTFDVFFSLISIIISPILVLFYKDKQQLLTNLIQCFVGKKSLVGYDVTSDSRIVGLPTIKKGILHPTDGNNHQEIKEKLNLIYARDYSIWKDIEILKRSWKNLDNN
jgi:O-antigen biosynthesis protein